MISSMTVHMVKLCVGADDVEDLKVWQRHLMKTAAKPYHHTRMVPKRAPELLEGGSIYWVIRGVIQVRQRIFSVESFLDRQGRRACEIVLEPEIVMVEPVPKRPFQGWRYLKADDAPSDLAANRGSDELPPGIRAQLKQALVW